MGLSKVNYDISFAGKLTYIDNLEHRYHAVLFHCIDTVKLQPLGNILVVFRSSVSQMSEGW